MGGGRGILGISFLFFFLGLFLYALAQIYPYSNSQVMEMTGVLILILPFFLLLYRIYVTRTWYLVKKLPIWKHLINYMRRDNEIIPIIGNRAFPGESFIEVPQLGLIEFLGKDCVYTWGDKKILWGLENINFTPDGKFSNLCGVLYDLGMQNSDDMTNVFSGNDLELMGTVYLNMRNYGNRGGSKLVEEMINYDGEFIDFEKEKNNNISISEKVDRIIARGDISGKNRKKRK